MKRYSSIISLAVLSLSARTAAGATSTAITISAVSAGSGHTCALTTDGRVLCWGENDKGQLGNDTTQSSSAPVLVSGISSKVAAIAAGYGHSCALTREGAVLCWGENAYGQLGNGSTKNSSTPVAVSGLSSGVTAIAAGGGHTCAITSGGGVQCWGNNVNGNLGSSKAKRSSVPVAVVGLDAGCAAITVGGEHTCAITTKGGLLCWGYNGAGQLGNNHAEESRVPVTILGLHSGVIAAAAGFEHTCALSSRSGVLCWGDNSNGQLGDESKENHHLPSAVLNLKSGVTGIAVGSNSSYALTSSGALRWGRIGGGLGKGDVKESLAPAAVSGLSAKVTAIAAGSGHACALTREGGVLCWGSNRNGELGNKSTKDSSVPVAVAF